MINDTYDSIIIGAGPIGSYLAHRLSSAGQKVLVLDKKSYPGQNICCTGIISQECYELLSRNIDIAARPANSANFYYPNGQCIRFWRNDNVALIVDRQALEQALVKVSESIGVEYQFNSLVEKIEYTPKLIQVSVNNKNTKRVIEAEASIIATGYGSNLATNLGLRRIDHFWIGAQTEIDVINIEEVEVFLDKTISPGGFAWLVPTKKGKGLAGLITSKQPKLYLNQFLSYLRSCGKIGTAQDYPRYAPIPLKPLAKTYAERLLVVGEAAGQVKPMTGGGIYFGILCAQIASDVLCEAKKSRDFSAVFLSQYQKRWHKRLIREISIGCLTQNLFSKLTNKQISYLLKIATTRDLPYSIATANDFSFDTHSKILLQAACGLLPFAKHSKPL